MRETCKAADVRPDWRYSFPMDQLTFDVDVAEDGRYVARAREYGIEVGGASFEEMQAKATDLARIHFANASPRPKIVRVAFEQVLSLS